MRCFPSIVLASLLLSLFAAAHAEPAAASKQRRPPSYPVPPDTRPFGCTAQTLDPVGNDFDNLKVSIIIPYRNEAWQHIRFSLESILYNTPKRYLAEILFVSDGNGPDNNFVDKLRAIASKTVSVLVLPAPGVGLIEAKMRAVGAAATNATVLVFMEPHIRVNKQWLQPLLRRLQLHPKALAMPALDYIPATDFLKYHQTGAGHWRFEWNLNLVYTQPFGTQDDPSKPYISPATSGGIFAIRRDWWDQLEFYDNGMLGWGGDHLEASFKVWRCGGHIEIVPCSRVGHLFREPEHRPYDVDVNRVIRNYGRVAEIWLDEYTPHFYKMKAEAKTMDLGDMSQQRSLRERLQCKDMKWYLENVDREMQWEIDHICVPGCSKSQAEVCCEKPVAGGRSTIDRILPAVEYRALKKWSPGEGAALGHGGEL